MIENPEPLWVRSLDKRADQVFGVAAQTSLVVDGGRGVVDDDPSADQNEQEDQEDAQGQQRKQAPALLKDAPKPETEERGDQYQVREVRDRANLSRDLANERARNPSLDVLMRLANAFGIEIGRFMGQMMRCRWASRSAVVMVLSDLLHHVDCRPARQHPNEPAGMPSVCST